MSSYGPDPARGGEHTFVCRECGAERQTDRPRQRYCDNACKKRRHNRRYYQRHRAAVLARVLRAKGYEAAAANVIEGEGEG